MGKKKKLGNSSKCHRVTTLTDSSILFFCIVPKGTENGIQIQAHALG